MFSGKHLMNAQQQPWLLKDTETIDFNMNIYWNAIDDNFILMGNKACVWNVVEHQLVFCTSQPGVSKIDLSCIHHITAQNHEKLNPT